MNLNKPITISERELPAFRQEFLTPTNILDRLKHEKALLLQLPLGAGKSYAADQILHDPKTFDRYDCVIYVGPTHAIIRERVNAFKELKNPMKHTVLQARPRKRCGDLDETWTHFEKKAA